jgi:hypothetical protein
MIPQRLIDSVVILVLLVAGVVLFTSFSSAFSSAHQWQDIGKQAPTELTLQIAQDNLYPGIPVDTGRMKIWKLKLSAQDRPLYLVDSRITDLAKYPHVNPLCGASGCAFLIYKPDNDRHFQQIWSAYLNVNLPPTVALFEPSTDLSHGLPILKINQMEGQRIRQLRLSFDGKVYEITQTTLMPQIYE